MGIARDLDALVVKTLEGETLNGFAIAQRIRARSERALRPGEGLVYPVLYRLSGEGVVTVGWQEREGKPPRKVYSLRGARGAAPAPEGGGDG